MNTNVIAYRVAEIHNSLAQMVSNGVDFKNADNVIMFGSAMNDLRAIVQELTKENEAPEKTDD